MFFSCRVHWEQWFFGIWWWPVKKDLAFGIKIGPIDMMWTRQEV